MTYYVYILTNKPGGTLYIGVTNNLARRLDEHRTPGRQGFTQRYNLFLLVYYEQTESIETAIQREKQLKSWYRRWKIELIQKVNPLWEDLSYLL